MDLNVFLSESQAVFSAMQANAHLALLAIGLLWSVQIINALLHYRLNYLGLFPRKIFGLVGIVFAPFLHGSFTHLFFNSIPLFVLINFILLNGLDNFIKITLGIIFIGGGLTWLIGRRAIHVGASGLIMGYWSYLLINAFYAPSVQTVILGLLAVYYFGSFFLHLFPGEEQVSWESHACGFIAGVIIYFI